MKKVFFRYFEEYVCAVVLSAMTLLTFANVVSRYVFHASFSFSDEITTYLFVLLSLLGAAVAAKRGAHLGFTLITDLVPFAARKVMLAVGFALAVLFCGLLFIFGVKMAMGQFARGQVTAGIQLPEWIFGSFVPFGAFFVTVRFAEALVRTVKLAPIEKATNDTNDTNDNIIENGGSKC
jgi:C4-dicarboxylate transporter DctQ subunit